MPSSPISPFSPSRHLYQTAHYNRALRKPPPLPTGSSYNTPSLPNRLCSPRGFARKKGKESGPALMRRRRRGGQGGE